MRFPESFIDDLKDRIAISDVVGSRVSWDRKKTKAARGDFWACCPFHAENGASFHCEDKKGRYHCFGCGASGDHFKFFTELDGVSFPRAVQMVADLAGVSLPDARPETPFERTQRLKREQDRAMRRGAEEEGRQKAQAEKRDIVRDLWSEAVPIAGTPGEKYLLGRGIPVMAWPASVRFHARMPFKPDDPDSRSAPAVTCGVQSRDRKLVATWRIFVNLDGTPLLDTDGKKLKLGFGPAGGGAVRFGPAGENVDVCEGVETGFGVGNLTKWKHPVWPLLSTSGMISWEPPAGVKRVRIWSDGDRYKVRKDGTIGDPPGRAAADKLKQRLEAMGIVASVQEPPAGSDWLDLWNTLQAEEGRVRDVEYARD